VHASIQPRELRYYGLSKLQRLADRVHERWTMLAPALTKHRFFKDKDTVSIKASARNC
jgi:hypothetical protein